MRGIFVGVLVVLGAALSGCANLYHVRAGHATLDGVPFYVKVAVCRQQQVFIEPLARLTLVEVDAKAEDVYSLVIRLEDLPPALEGDPQAIMKSLGDKRWTPEPWPGAPSLPRYVLVANTADLVAQVDYSRTHYVNVKKPWIGGASATADLAPDGTLSKASAEVEDKTLSTLLDVLPVGPYLSKVLEPAKDRAPSPYRIRVEMLAYRHTLTRQAPAQGAGSCSPAIRLDPTSASYTREAIAADHDTKQAEEAPGSTTGNVARKNQTARR